MASRVVKGFGLVAITPGYSVDIKLGYCSLTAIRTTSKTISDPGAKTRSAPVAADTTTSNSRLKLQKGLPLGKPKIISSRPRVNAVKAAAQQPW